MAGTRKTQHDISPRMRAAFFEGFCNRAKSQGFTLSQYAEKLWEEDWKACIHALAKFLPTEAKVTGRVEHDHKHTHVGLSATAQLIEQVIGEGADRALSEPRPH